MQPETDPKTIKLFTPQIFSHWKPCDTILDSYRVEDVISTGGMGRIYVTNHVLWKVKVAIKSPRGEMLGNENLYARITREADAWTNLGLHPHIAYCYFVRAIENVPHLFVEYVDGGNLRKWIEDGRCSDFEIALDLAIQFCHGMAYAHSKGMIHRDIKPENILMTKGGILKITDFGIARWGKEENSLEDITLTDDMKTVGFIGTRAYASPEQLMDAHTVGPETDIFSFGVCLWEMLVGQRPYVLAIKELPLPDLKRFRPDLSDQFTLLLTNLVAYERESRRKIGGFDPLKDRLESIYQELFHKPSPHKDVEKIDLKADGLNNRGVSYMELGKEADALSCFQEAITVDHQHLEATFNHSYLQWQRGQITNDALLAHLKQIEPAKGSTPDYWRYLAWLHLERGDVEAVEKIQVSTNRITNPDFLRAYADPNKPLAKMVKVFEGHKEMVFSAAFSPDGRKTLSWSFDNNLILWDVATGREIKRFEEHFEEYDSDNLFSVFTFSPKLKYGLGFESDSLMLWDVETGRLLRRFNDEPTNVVYSVCFSPDERYALSGGKDETIRLWDIAMGKEVRRFYGHTGIVYSVCFSHDVKYALSGGKDKTIRLWNIATGKEVRRFYGHTGIVYSVCFSPNERYALSGGDDGTLRCWEVANGDEIWCFKSSPRCYDSIAFSPNGKYVLGSDTFDDDIGLWEVATGKHLRTFEGHTDYIYSVCFSPDGNYALSWGKDNTVRLWMFDFSKKSWKSAHPYPAISRLKPLTELRLEQIEARTLLNEASISIKKGLFQDACLLLRKVQAISGYERPLEVLDLVASCVVRGRGKIQNLRAAWPSATFKGHANGVLDYCFSPDGKYVLSGSWDATIRLWEIPTGKELRRFNGHTDGVLSITFSPDVRYALSGSKDKTLRLWDVVSGRELRRFEGHTGRVSSVCFSPDGRYALSGSMDKTLRFWEVSTGNELRRFEGHTNHVRSVCFSPDEKYALSGGSDKTLRLWDMASGRDLKRFEGHTHMVNSVCFSPDGRYALSSSEDDTCRLWEVTSGKELRRVERTIKFGGYYLNGLLSGRADDVLRFWNIATGKYLQRFEEQIGTAASYCFLFSPNGRYALVANGDDIILWEFDWEWEFPKYM